MKKIITFLFAAVFATAANAQEESVKIGIDAYPWNYTAEVWSADIVYNDQWGEFGIINADNAISPADYKGCRIEYQAFPETAQITDESTSYVQLKIADSQYMPLSPNGSEVTVNFNEAVMALETINALNVQGVTPGARVFVKNFYLIKTDGTEERMEKFAANGWGFKYYTTSADLTFTGQYGSVRIVDESLNDITYTPGSGEKAYIYTIELEEPAPNGFMIEFDDENGGFKYLNFAAGVSTVNVEVSDATCGGWVDDVFVNKDLKSMYLKSDQKEGYPFVLKIKKITRAELVDISQEPEELEGETLALNISEWPWRYEFKPNGFLPITFNNKWAEYGIIGESNPISTTEYVGIRVEYDSYPTDGEYAHLVIGDGLQYVDFNPEKNVLGVYFNDKVKAAGELSKLNVQAKTEGVKIKINKAYLVKANGTLELIKAFDGGGWGFEAGAPGSGRITYTGQWGAINIINAESGEDVTFTSNSGDIPYKYVFEFEDEAENGFMVELDENDKAGFQYNNVAAGTKTYELEVSDATCTAWLEEGKVNKDMTSMWLKSNTAEGYPFNLQVKRIYRVALTSGKLGDVTGDGEINLADLMTLIDYQLGMNPEVFVKANSDLNGNNETDLADVFMLVDILLTQE